ncbi:MAG: glycosyltransferase [Gammaproteobacteria bacterium]
MRNVLIYRHQLFTPSETFIACQAGALRRFRPVYAGRLTLGEPPLGSRVATLQGTSRVTIARQALLRDPRPLHARTRGYGPALIHAHFGVEGLYALGLAKRLKVPLVTTFHGFDATTTRLALLRSRKASWIHYALFGRRLIRHGDLFVCVSDYIRERVLAAGFPQRRVVRHYIGIDTDVVRPSATLPTRKTIIHVARLVEKKGTRYLIQAFARLAGRDIDAELVIIGDGPLLPELRSFTAALGLNARVHFLGVMPHATVLEWLGRAALLALPSVTARSGDSEGLGMVLLEAAARAVPVVGTRHGGIPEAVREGETGYLVPERDVEALAERLAHLLANDGLRQAMGQAARRLVEEKFNLQRQTDALEDLYESLL